MGYRLAIDYNDFAYWESAFNIASEAKTLSKILRPVFQNPFSGAGWIPMGKLLKLFGFLKEERRHPLSKVKPRRLKFKMSNSNHNERLTP